MGTRKNSPEDMKILNDRCISALVLSYKIDTEGKNRQAGVEWKTANEGLYNSSQSFISAIVQNWYLDKGREQEKNTFGCFSVILFIFLFFQFHIIYYRGH